MISVKYRLMIGEDNDDFIYNSNLTYDEASKEKEALILKEGVYAYIEEDD